MTSVTASEKSLEESVLAWLTEEGFPLEFRTAHVFRQGGFDVHQGFYVQDVKTVIPREVDVIGQATLYTGERSFLRVCNVVECKYSKDRPWVVFTSGYRSLAPSACVAQTIGDEAGTAILWSLAGDQTLQSLGIFSTPIRSGFAGRQAFKGNDVFYNAVQSISSAALSLAQYYEDPLRHDLQCPDHAVFILPVIVLHGLLFEASYNAQTNSMSLEKVNQTRLHWRGTESSLPHVHIDIVTIDHLESFVSQRYKETQEALGQFSSCFKQINECFVNGTLEHLKVTGGSTGMRWLPRLLYQFEQARKMSDGVTLLPHPQSD